tara:strand:- start:2639 stop:2950 length:312 start_codon:yes stop_codon:yes gene_type:complete
MLPGGTIEGFITDALRAWRVGLESPAGCIDGSWFPIRVDYSGRGLELFINGCPALFPQRAFLFVDAPQCLFTFSCAVLSLDLSPGLSPGLFHRDGTDQDCQHD